jgi:hypothetical protein
MMRGERPGELTCNLPLAPKSVIKQRFGGCADDDQTARLGLKRATAILFRSLNRGESAGKEKASDVHSIPQYLPTTGVHPRKVGMRRKSAGGKTIVAKERRETKADRPDQGIAIDSLRLFAGELGTINRSPFVGALVQQTDQFIVAYEVTDSFVLDGIALVPKEKLLKLSWRSARLTLVGRVLRTRYEAGVARFDPIDARNFRDAATQFCSRFPLVAFHIERIRDPYVVLGAVESFGQRSANVRSIDAYARHEGSRAVSLDRVERIEAASMYVDAFVELTTDRRRT